jgi:hypothetical protein
VPELVQHGHLHLFRERVVVRRDREQVRIKEHDARGPDVELRGAASVVRRSFEESERARVESLAHELRVRTRLEDHGHVLHAIGEVRR